MFNNKKRKDTTYLKMKNGKIVNTPNPFTTKEDVELDNQEKAFNDFNEEVKQKELNPQNKKSKSFIIIGLIFILLPFTIIGFKVGKNQISQLQEYMILGNNKTDSSLDTNDRNNNISSNNDNNISSNNDVHDNKKPNNVSKSVISDLLSITNTVNTSINTTYSGLKTDVILFAENRESLYVTRNKLKTRYEIVKTNKDYIFKKQSFFVKHNQEELFNLFMTRFDILLETINEFSTEISRTNAIEVTNKSIIDDNDVMDKEISIIKNLLSDNNVDYVENENGISLKE